MGLGMSMRCSQSQRMELRLTFMKDCPKCGCTNDLSTVLCNLPPGSLIMPLCSNCGAPLWKSTNRFARYVNLHSGEIESYYKEKRKKSEAVRAGRNNSKYNKKSPAVTERSKYHSLGAFYRAMVAEDNEELFLEYCREEFLK